MGNGTLVNVPCSGKRCGWGKSGNRLGCQSGDGSCFSAMMLRAECSEFHDADMEAATLAINGILRALPAERNGRVPAFLLSEHGLLLAWVEHDVIFRSGEDVVTAESSGEEIIAALGLEMDEYSSEKTAHK